MAIDKKRISSKKVKVLTKRQKSHRRVLKVHKAVQKKRKQRLIRKKNASTHRKKVSSNQQNQFIQMSQPKIHQAPIIEPQMDILNLLGFGGAQQQGNWAETLQKKLTQVDDKSLDNPQVKRVYGEIGKIFSRYRSGKIPKAFKIIPKLQKWKQVLKMTRPEQWTSQAMVQTVNIFASNLSDNKNSAEQFYRTWLVPTVKRDLANNKKLNVHLYQALKKALYKTNAWFKGILFQFCGENTLLRQVKVMQSLLSKMSIPVVHASVFMIKLMQLPPTTPVIHYLRALLNKHYTLPKRVLTTFCSYLLQFSGQQNLLVVWQQLFLTLVKQYGQSLDEMSKASLLTLAKQNSHKLITPQIVKFLG